MAVSDMRVLIFQTVMMVSCEIQIAFGDFWIDGGAKFGGSAVCAIPSAVVQEAGMITKHGTFINISVQNIACDRLFILMCKILPRVNKNYLWVNLRKEGSPPQPLTPVELEEEPFREN